MAKSDEQVIEEFNEAVNMNAEELEDWLETEESKSVGQSDGDGESKGHESGRRIVEILKKYRSDYTDEDIDHMRRVVSYVHRHKAQKPEGDVRDSNWRYGGGGVRARLRGRRVEEARRVSSGHLEKVPR